MNKLTPLVTRDINEEILARVYLDAWLDGRKAGRRAISPLTIHDIRKNLCMLEVTIANMREFLDMVENGATDEDSDNGC